MTSDFMEGHVFADPRQGLQEASWNPPQDQLRKGMVCMEQTEKRQPHMFGMYRELKPIGTGGFAEVYLVEDNLGRKWALKQIRQDLVKQDPEGFRKRFEREARIQAGLKHPCIAGVHTFDAREGYLVIEYINGETLQDFLNNCYPDGMDLETAVEILRPIEEALTYIHTSAGFAHLDIKPNNILVQEISSPKGETKRRVVLADFGLARVIDADGRAEVTRREGTPPYWAPEQVDPAKGTPGTSSDIYALGLLIGVLLTGRRAQEVLDLLRGTNKTLPARLPPQVKRVVQRATEEDPRNRYATVRGLFTAFTQAVKDWEVYAQNGGQIETFDPGNTELAPSLVRSPSSLIPPPPQRTPAGWREKIGVIVPYYAILTTLVLLGFVAWTLVQSLPATHFTQLGGVDLGTYCTSLGYHGNTADVSCSSPIQLDLACDWQHETTGLRAEFTTPGDPYTADCFDSHGKEAGRIKNMNGYCTDPRQGYLGMPTAVVEGNTWVCEQKIVMTLVCMWQYSKTDVQARKNDQGLWGCYGLW
jgi:serine/threonine protein kinase